MKRKEPDPEDGLNECETEGFDIDGVLDSGPDDSTAGANEADLRANDPACMWCDDGGNIMSCDGICMRSFHIGMEPDETYSSLSCNPMEMPEDLARRLNGSSESFKCPNCVTLTHQCFSCKAESSSDPSLPAGSSTVIRCVMFECGKFYHPHCLPGEKDDSAFICPLHFCAAAASGECFEEEGSKLPLVPCRRCPVAYHEACIPKELMQTRQQKTGKRVWLAKFDRHGKPIGDPVDRSLLYCMNHEIPEGDDNPAHESPLFSEELLLKWRLHYAETYKDLPSSIEVFSRQQETLPTQTGSPPAGDRCSPRSTIPSTSAALLFPPVEAETEMDPPSDILDKEGIGLEDSLAPYFDWQYWTKEAIAARSARASEDVKRAITLEGIKKSMRMPEPYKMPFRKTITEERLSSLKQIFDLAGSSGANRDRFITQPVHRELHSNENTMRIVLAPYLQSVRYSSFGRHFTKTDQLEYVAKKLQVFAQSMDVVVDFSCGANEFVSIFQKECLRHGKLIHAKAFDIITPLNVENFMQKSWFDVTPGSLGESHRLIIGLNPPYGMNNVLAEKFLAHAILFQPRVIVLIVPPTTSIPGGYRVALEDQQTMSDKAFYIPGIETSVKEQWNKVTPSFRILVRSAYYPFSDQLHNQDVAPAAKRFYFNRPQQALPPTHGYRGIQGQ